jgi:autotransporter-associated beta strand protein
LTIGNNNITSIYAGNLSGLGSLNKVGTGSFTVGSNANGGGGATYAGNTTISAGTLVIGGTSSLGGTIDLTSSIATTVFQSNLIVQDNAVINATGRLTLASNDGGNANNYPGASTVIFKNNSNSTFPAIAFGSGGRLPTGNSITIQDNASVTVNGSIDLRNSEGSTVGGSVINLNGGTLAVQRFILTGGGGGTSTETLHLNGGTLMALANDPSASTFLPVLGGLTADVDAGGAIINTGTNSITFSQVLVDGSHVAATTHDGGLTKNGTGTLFLIAADSFNGGATLNAGILNINGEFALGGAVYGGLTFNGGTLQYASTIPGTNGTTDITQKSAATPVQEPVTISAGGATIDTNGNNVTYAYPLGNNGTGGLTKVGVGNLTLNGAQSYTGTTTVNVGKITLASGSSYTNPTAAFVVNSGASLAMASGNTFSTASPAFTVNSGGTLALQGDTIGTTSAGITVNGGGVYTQQNGAVDTVTLNSAGAGTGTVLTVGDSNAAGNFYFDINSTTSDELILNNGIAAFGAKGGKIFVDDLDTNPLTGPYTLISSPNGGLATGSGGGAFFQLGTLSLVVNGTTYGLSLSTSTANAEILTASVLSVATYYWTGGTSGSWSVPGNFATDQLGATPETQVPGVSNSVFLTANSASNLSNMTLDGNYTVNSLAFTGTNTAATTAATSPITLAAGNNSSNTITINALSGFSDNVGNTYSGGVGLVVQPGSAQHTISANVQLGSNQTWEIDNAPSNGLIVSGTIGDAGSGFGISKTGLGTLIIAGAATYSGTTAITSGTVQLGNGVAGGGTLSGPVLNNSALVLDRPDDYTLSTNMAGTGNLTQVGGDNVTLTGTNTFTGVTVIAAGSLITGVPQALEGTVVNYNNQGGTLSFGTLTAATLGGLSGSQNLALLNTNAAGVALSVGFGSQNSAYFGALSDGGSGAPGALTKIGTGTFALNGANTYDGPTTISAGTLQISAANNLGDASANNTIIFTGGTLESTANSYDLGATRSVLLTGTGTFQVDTGSALTVSGVVSGGGGIGKTGTGTLILTSPNTYSGVTTINAGALNVQTATALGGTANGTIVNAGGALQLQGGITIATEALTLNGTGVGNTGALRNVSGANSYTGPVTLASAARINSDSGTLTVATIGGAFPLTIGGLGNTTVTGAITTGANLVTLDGAGIVTFSGANTFTGNIVVNGGELIANEGNGSTGVVATSLGDADTAGRSVTVTNGTLVFAVPNVTGGGSQSAPANYTAFSLTNSTWNFTAAGGNATVGAVTLNGSTINIQNTGSQALYEAIGFAGSVTVSGTASAITGLGGAFEGANLGIGNPVAAGYQTTFTVGNTVNGTASGGTAPDLTVGIPLVNGNNNAVAVSTGLILNGPGTLLLTATNTYTGPTTINSGTLQLGNGTAGNDGTIANSSGITDNGALVYNRSGALSSGVLISGNGSVTISGSGSQTLTAANTYTGPTTITSGATLQLGNGTAGNDGTIQGSSGITDNGTLIYDRFNVLSSAVAISGTGAVTVTGAGTQYLTAVNSYSGLTTINSGATLELGNGSSGSDGTILNTSGITDNGTLVYNRFGNLSSSIVISGNGGVTVSGPGSQTLTAANSYSGTTIINSGGTLQLGDGTAGHDGTILNTSGITDNGTLIYNRSGALSSGIVIAGAGAVKVSGTGSQTLTAANTYTGATTINSGATLQLGNGTSGNDGTIASSSGITDNGSLIYNRSGALSSGVAITGAGSVIKTGTGTQTLSSTGDSYSGGTTISQGTLIVTGSLSGAGAVNLNAGVLGGGGSITGALTVATNATVYPGTGLNSAGTKLTLANSVVFGASSSLTINLNPTAGTSDTLAVGGALTLDPGNTDILTLNLLNVPATVGPGTYIIATYNSSSPLTGTFGSVVQNGGNLGAYSVNYNVPGGANIDEITVTVVPEPGTWASLIAGFGILIAFQNRRRRRNG